MGGDCGWLMCDVGGWIANRFSGRPQIAGLTVSDTVSPPGGRAEDWRFGGAWRRDHPEAVDGVPELAGWPVDRPKHWRRLVNQPQNDKELKAIRECIRRGRPWGDESWQQRTAKRLGLESTLRPRGRPRRDAPQ